MLGFYSFGIKSKEMVTLPKNGKMGSPGKGFL